VDFSSGTSGVVCLWGDAGPEWATSGRRFGANVGG
jgi:hypothetical protein